MTERPTIKNYKLTEKEINEIKKDANNPLLDVDSNIENFIITLPEKRMFILKRSEVIFENQNVDMMDFIRGVLYKCDDVNVSTKESLKEYFQRKEELEKEVNKFLNNIGIDKIVVNDHVQSEQNIRDYKEKMLSELLATSELNDLDKKIISKTYYDKLNKAKEERNKKNKSKKH